jgi:ABC-2 type transport system ATP-binding protein
MNALEVRKLSKVFKQPNGKEFKALDEVSLTVEPGKIYGLLGPNGAGKSTLISIISGVLSPTTGEVLVFDKNVAKETEKTKQMLGVVPQEIVVELAFTLEEVLHYFSGMYGLPLSERAVRTKEVLEDLSLIDKKDDRARNLSGGMKRRLMVAKAIMHKPKFLILDEPTAGVDVALRQKIWELVKRINAKGTTILFTTHYLEEAERLCDSITLINHGKVVKQGKLSDIQREFKKDSIHFELFDESKPLIAGAYKQENEFEFPVKNLGEEMKKIIDYYGSNLKSIRSAAPSLESIFLELTK